MSKQKYLKNSHGRKCIFCTHWRSKTKIYQLSKSLIQHIHKSHNLSPEKIEIIREISKNYVSGDFLKICNDRGVYA